MGVDLRQALGVLGTCALGLGTIRHALAQKVERDPKAVGVQCSGDVQRFLRRVTRHETTRHPVGERELEQDPLEVVSLAQKQECLLQHQLSVSTGADGFAR